MSKLLFTFESDYQPDIVLVADDHKSLKEELKKRYDWYFVKVEIYAVYIIRNKRERCGMATLEQID